jgi:hypothetical protein
VQAEKSGYQTKIIPNVALQTNTVTTLDIALAPEIIVTQNPDAEETVRVAPTLFSDRLTVEIAPESLFAKGKTLLRLTDFSGKIISEKNADGRRTTLENLENLPAGTSFLTLQNEEGNSRTFRVVK